MQITGGCFCGQLQYEAELDERMVGICHCRDCQIFSGSAFRLSGIVPPDKFSFTRGTPTFFDKIADSGSVRRMAFCAHCGTHLCSLPGKDGGYVSIRVASANEFADIRPVAEFFCASRVSWMDDLEGTARFDGMFGSED